MMFAAVIKMSLGVDWLIQWAERFLKRAG